MSESMGWASALAINPYANLAATTTFSASSFRLSFLDNHIQETIELVQDEGLRGTRTRNVERVALGLNKVAGTIKLRPNVVELESLMPFILGTASSAGSYVVADTLPNLYLLADFVANVGTFTTRVTKATFSGSPGQPIDLTLDLVGTVMSLGAAGTFASASIPAINIASRQYMFYDDASGITVNGTGYAIDQFQLTIDNKIVPTYMMGATATDIEPTDRVITLSVRTKFTSGETTLQTDQRAGTPRTGSLSFTNGASTFSFTFGNLLAHPESVVVPDRNHLRLPSNYQAYGVSTTKDVVVALPA
jgi:hypothetical protein